jgi:transcriptional regulator with XRE-family HTH domain
VSKSGPPTGALSEALEGSLETLARNLSAARTAMGLSQDHLADAAGISRATVIQLEAGTGDPRLSTLTGLAMALDVSPVFFLFGRDELSAIASLHESSDGERVQAHLSKDEQEVMRRLLRSGLAKNRTKAVKMGAEAAVAAGMAAGVVASAAIGTAVLPVIGTAIGAALGAIWARSRNGRAGHDE